jgi:DNA-binding transcriptional MerR regulator
MEYSIKEIAELAGITTRTIRYYGEIGLLLPTRIGDNGYRYYNRESLLRLQQIMFFRELDMPLKEIQFIMSRPDFNLTDALEKHRLSLSKQLERTKRLIHTLDQTINSLKGKIIMQDKDYFNGFEEAEYEEEARQRWGNTPAYAESQKKWAGYSPEQKEAIKKEGGQITRRMVGTHPDTAADDADVQTAIGDYYAYINQYFYDCDLDFLHNLAEMWVADPRFAVNYDRIRAGGAEFVRKAVQIYCERNS